METYRVANLAGRGGGKTVKVIRVGRARVRGMFDLYNLFNASTILSRNNTFASTWGRPTVILGGRLFKFGVQLDF